MPNLELKRSTKTIQILWYIVFDIEKRRAKRKHKESSGWVRPFIRGYCGWNRWSSKIFGFHWPFGWAWNEIEDKEIDDIENCWTAKNCGVKKEVVIAKL